MCFVISKTRKPWRQSRVYKVVSSTRTGPYFDGEHYWDDAVVRAKKQPEEIRFRSKWRPRSGTEYSNNGIYVYRSKAFAISILPRSGGYCVIELEVRRADFLHQSCDGKQATYRRVRVVGQVQP